MIAIYERDKKLNVRERPDAGSRVVRQMSNGDSEECFGEDNGWVRLRDGFAMAKFLVVRDSAHQEKPVPNAEAPAPERPAPEQPADDDRAVLRAKTVSELRDMAAKCGIAVRKGAKKEEIIDAILNDD